MGWYPENRDLVVPAHNARAGLDCRSGQVLAWADSVRPDSIDCCRRICKYGVLAAALLPSIEDLRRSEDGVGLRIERPLVDENPAWEGLAPAPLLVSTVSPGRLPATALRGVMRAASSRASDQMSVAVGVPHHRQTTSAPRFLGELPLSPLQLYMCTLGLPDGRAAGPLPSLFPESLTPAVYEIRIVRVSGKCA